MSLANQANCLEALCRCFPTPQQSSGVLPPANKKSSSRAVLFLSLPRSWIYAFASMDYNPRQPAAVACLSCRKLKMKCIGGGDPPCRRCLKSNRECVVRLPNRNQRRSSSLQTHTYRNPPPVPASPISSRSHSSMAQERKDRSPSLIQGQSPIDQDNPSLPSIFSSTPLSIATTKLSESGSSFGGHTSYPRLEPDHLSASLVCDLVGFFLQRLAFYVPVLSLEPVEEPNDILGRQQPLAYAMAFVASTFALGYSSTRRSLYPHMLQLIEQASDIHENTMEENWTLLQSLAVLYAYPEVAIKLGKALKKHLSIWSVKSAVETCAMQQSLHHSVGHLNKLVCEGSSNPAASLTYRRTFYWLWLFVKSRHHSVITRTPPTIHNDSTITSTVDLLLHLGPSQSVWRILAEAALHRMWDEAALRDKDLGEWWCMPSNTKDIGSLQELLRGTEEMLQEWSASWLHFSGAPEKAPTKTAANEPHIASSVTPFMGLLTRFNMISFAASIITHQLRTKSAEHRLSLSLSSPEFGPFLDCVLKSADAARNCCASIIEMKPTDREFLRYTPDYGFTMIALCCLHIVYAYNMSPGNPTLRGYLVKAEQVAYLMMELGGPNNALPHVYGECILSHLQNSTLSAGKNGGHAFANDTQPEMVANRGDFSVSQMPEEHIPIPLDLNYPWPDEFSSTDLMGSMHGQLPDLFSMYSNMLLSTNAN
ncbi:hypothetical protein BJX64DRAFT_71342 [Aspergillus heterothallicus]